MTVTRALVPLIRESRSDRELWASSGQNLTRSRFLATSNGYGERAIPQSAICPSALLAAGRNDALLPALSGL
jgi:hypothetical protein